MAFRSQLTIYLDAEGEELDEMVDNLCDRLAEHGYGNSPEDDDSEVVSMVCARHIEALPDGEDDLAEWLRQAVDGYEVIAFPNKETQGHGEH